MEICINCSGGNLQKHLFTKGEIKLCKYCRTKSICTKQSVFFNDIFQIIKNNFIPIEELTDLDRCMIEECGSNEFYTTMLDALLSDEGMPIEVYEEFILWLKKTNQNDLVKSILVFNNGELDGYNSFATNWDNLTDEIKNYKRFINQNSIDFFKKLYNLVGIESHITTINKDIKIYRARKFNNEEDFNKIETNTPYEMGTVPHCLAKNQRMTPIGISAFYGSFDLKTCISEVRPIVGGYVATCKFKPSMTIKLLDLTASLTSMLKRRSKKIHVMDKDSSIYCQAVSFILNLVKEISKPSIDNEDLDYLPSQLFFEYLRDAYSNYINGIIFPSIQNKSGKNIVLFPENSRMESSNYEPSHKSVECLMHFHYTELIEYVNNSLKIHKINKIETKFDTYKIKDKNRLFLKKGRSKTF